MSKTIIFIDGANFYGGIKNIKSNYSDLNFDFEKYINEKILEDGDELLKVYYYNSPLKNLKGKEELYSNQQRFFENLKHIKKFKVILCKRQKRFDINKNEYFIIKGDDVYLARDFTKCLYETNVKKIILFSGDGDFEPIIKLAKEKEKIVNLVYFKNYTSKNILNITNKKFLITRHILNKYFCRREHK